MEDIIRLLIKHYERNIIEINSYSIVYYFSVKELKLSICLDDKWDISLFVESRGKKGSRYKIEDLDLYKEVEEAIKAHRNNILEDIKRFLKSGIK